MAKKGPRDPNAPKRNVSAYLHYQNAMRDEFKSQNPGMSFGQLSKFTSAMYAELASEEKALWTARAEEDKARFLQELAGYVPPPGYDAKGDSLVPSPPVAGAKRRTKKERDPNAPKRAKTAYLLYQNAMRDQFRTENPGMTFGQLSKYTSAMYKCLTPEEKELWDQRAAEDKARFHAEMETYVPPPGHDPQGNVIEEFRPKEKKGRKSKDPYAPKRARGSFVYFTLEERPKVMQENPDTKFVELGSILGERWRNLPEEERQKYNDLAAEDKLRFSREMQQYQANKVVYLAPPPVEAAAAAAPHEIYMPNMDHLQYDPAVYQQQVYDQTTYQYE